MLEHLKNHPHYDQALKMANNMTHEQKTALLQSPIARSIMKNLNLGGSKLSKKRKSRRRTKKGGKLSKKRKSRRRSKRR